MAKSTAYWDGSAYKTAVKQWPWDGSSWRYMRRQWVWDGSNWKQCFTSPPNAVLTSATGEINDSTSFIFSWTISGTTTGMDLKVFHVPSGLEVFSLGNPANSDSDLIDPTSNSGDQHVARLYDDLENMVSEIFFTPEL